MGRNALHLPNWLRWLLGAITFLGLAILILSVVLGVRAGQEQLALRSRQQIAISLQNALDLQTQGDIEGAFDAYRSVLVLDPNNPAATEGVQALLRTGAGGSEQLATGAQPGEANSLGQAIGAQSGADRTQSQQEAQPAVASASSTDVALFDEAQTAFQTQDWQTVIDTLSKLRSNNPDYRSSEVTEFLYTAHYTSATELEARNNVKEAITAYDAAIAVHPNPIGAEVGKELLNKYVEALSIDEADYWRLIAALEGIYQADRNYRDISSQLQQAYVRHGDSLVSEQSWCLATDQYNNAVELDITPGLMSKRNRYQQQCDEEGPDSAPLAQPDAPSVASVLNASSGRNATGATTASSGEAEDDDDSASRSVTGLAVSNQSNTEASSNRSSTTGAQATNRSSANSSQTDEATDSQSAVATAEPTVPPAPTGAVLGKIIYAATDSADGRSRIFMQPVNGAGSASMIIEDASQPAYRSDGSRLVYRNTRSDAIGLTAHDPGTDLFLRFTDFGEDGFPRWSPEGNRIVFASTREGDRRSRIFIAWAEVGGAASNHSFGETPSWHPTLDLIAYRGCDERGNACGLWTMDGNGGSRKPITQVVADSHPGWSPDGSSMVFMSSGRDGNPEIYRLSTSSGEVTRLTNAGGIDGSPAVSPSGNWVGFLSNRNGRWGIWRVPLTGGEAQLVAPFTGQPGEWQSQQLQWIP